MAAKRETRSSARKDLGDVVYIESDSLPIGVLPTRKDIIQSMMYLLRPQRAGQAQRTRDYAAHILSYVVNDHWLFCNIYTMRPRHIEKHILQLYKQFNNLIQTRSSRRNEAYLKRVEDFNNESMKLFDVFCQDEETRKKLEAQYEVKMDVDGWEYLNDERGACMMFCENFVDKKWEKTVKRRQYELSLEGKKESDEPEEDIIGADNEDKSMNVTTGTCIGEPDMTYTQSDDDIDTTDAANRRKFKDDSTRESEELPERFRHLRLSERKVRPEVYSTIDKLKTVYHCTEKQASAALVEVGNIMFETNWKFHEEGENITVNTLPESKNIRTASEAIEAMTISEIAHLINNTDSNISITYSDDGSRKQGVGNFVVQGITVDGKHRALPTLGIERETRTNLAELKLTTFKILEVASGIPAKKLFQRVNFVMTDQTAHNFEVASLVCEELQIDQLPFHLFCNVHPTLMFNRILVKCWTKVEEQIGLDKLYSTILVDTTNRKDSVTEQSIDCFTRVINHDFDHKPWNYSREFDESIAPRKNMSQSLKDERFERLTQCAATTLHHYEDGIMFLDQMTHVSNQLTCITRSFFELEFLPILYTMGALIGLHLHGPFLSLTMSNQTDYSQMIPAFKQLHQDFLETDPEKLLEIDRPAFSFVSDERFQASKYPQEVTDTLQVYVDKYRDYLPRLFKILLPMLAHGFQEQKGHIFGFGDTTSKTDEYRVDLLPEEVLKGVPVHNLAEERAVGFINYELGVRGTQHLTVASSTMVKNQSADLIAKSDPGAFRAHQKSAVAIKEVKLTWNEKQGQLRKEKLSEKKIANLSIERRKNQDLETLKKLGGPFTNPRDVAKLMRSRITDEKKNQRLYVEVRYARDTSLSHPKKFIFIPPEE